MVKLLISINGQNMITAKFKKKKDNFLIEIFCLYVTEVSTSVSKNDRQ